MNLIEIMIIAFGVAMDAFAVSICAGSSRFLQTSRAKFRLSFHFGLFQFMMPVIGWYAGTQIAQYFSRFDHWIAFALLTYVGGKMIHSGLHPEEKSCDNDPSRKLNLVILSVATSIDALAVGVSLAMLKINIWYPSMAIGCVTFVFSLAGILIGRRAGSRFGCKMEITGGVVLFCIAMKILLTHITG